MSQDKRGTGELIATQRIGDLDLWIAIYDDGYTDSDVSYRVFEDPDNVTQEEYSSASAYGSITGAVSSVRYEMGEESFLNAFDDGGTSTTPSYDQGPFICDDCGLTNPSKWNATPNGSEDICKDCHDE